MYMDTRTVADLLLTQRTAVLFRWRERQRHLEGRAIASASFHHTDDGRDDEDAGWPVETSRRAYALFPDYFDRLIVSLDGAAGDSVTAAMDWAEFTHDEGLHWALIETPIAALASLVHAFSMDIDDALRVAIDEAVEKGRMEGSERPEARDVLRAISERAYAAFFRGYDEGRSRLNGSKAIRTADLENANPDNSPRIFGSRPAWNAIEVLHKVNSAVNSSLDLDSVLNLTVQAVQDVARADACSIYVFERDKEALVLRATRGLNEHAIGRVVSMLGEGVTGWAAREGRPLAIYDVRNDDRFRTVPELDEGECRSMLAVPIILFTREQLVGVISLQSNQLRHFRADEISFAEMVAGELAFAIENARLYQQTDERLKQKVIELTTLQEVSNMIAATLDHEQVLDVIMEQATKLIGADMAAIYERKEQSDFLTIIANKGLSEDYVKQMRVRIGSGPVGRAAEFKRPVNVWDAYYDLHPDEEMVYHNQYRSSLCAPLNSPRGVLGVICIYTRDQRNFTDEHLQTISAFADQAAIAIENARLYEEARRGLTIKTALLQEMHHRVRNNLQTVAALLSMQQRRATDPDVKAPLGESVARIQSIAAIHDLLSRADIGVTTVQAVAKEIVDIARTSLVSPDKHIHFKIDSGATKVASKEATLLAILIMELISNAIFHGFEEERAGGEIRISAFVIDGRTQIEIRDNGVGYPNDFDATKTKGLGLQIVHTLVTKDLQGHLRFENVNGWATATINFTSLSTTMPDDAAPQEDYGIVAV